MSERELEAIKTLIDNYHIQEIKNFKTIDYNVYLERMSEKLKKWYLNLSLNDYSSYELTTVNYLHNNRLCSRISVTSGIGLMGKVLKKDGENEKLDLLIYLIKFLEKLTNKNLCSKVFLPFYSFESKKETYIYVIIINNPAIKDSEKQIIKMYLNQFKNKFKINSKQYI